MTLTRAVFSTGSSRKNGREVRQQLEDDMGSRKGLLRTGYVTLGSYAEIHIPETENLML